MSQNETIKKIISNALDDNKDLNDNTEKKNLIDLIQKENPDFQKNSIKTTFSKFLKSESEKRGIKPKNVKPKQRFNNSLSVNISGNKSPTIENPLAQKDNKTETPKTNIAVSMCETAGNTCYSMLRMHDSDMEDFTEQERKDFGEIIKYFADNFGGGDKFNTFLMLLAGCGMIIKKKHHARNKRKQTKQKQEKIQQESPKKQINADKGMITDGAKLG